MDFYAAYGIPELPKPVVIRNTSIYVDSLAESIGRLAKQLELASIPNLRRVTIFKGRRYVWHDSALATLLRRRP